LRVVTSVVSTGVGFFYIAFVVVQRNGEG
jgi:hypothetical protein